MLEPSFTDRKPRKFENLKIEIVPDLYYSGHLLSLSTRRFTGIAYSHLL